MIVFSTRNVCVTAAVCRCCRALTRAATAIAATSPAKPIAMNTVRRRPIVPG